MKLFLNIMAIVLLVTLIVCAVLYWSTGVFYPICGVTLILFIIVVAGCQKYKKEK